MLWRSHMSCEFQECLMVCCGGGQLALWSIQGSKNIKLWHFSIHCGFNAAQKESSFSISRDSRVSAV